MNRETKRMMQRQGQVEADGSPSARRQPPAQASKRPAKQPDEPSRVQFVREIRDELRQVAWPTRPEVINYTAVVLITLVLMISLIFALNYVFGRAIFFMFQK